MHDLLLSQNWLENPGYMYDCDGNSEPLTIYRYSGFVLPIQCEDMEDYFVSVTGYSFALIIAAVPSINSPQAKEFGYPVIINNTPDVQEPGLVTFNLLPGDTGSLQMSNRYHLCVWVQYPNVSPAVKIYRRINLIDAFTMPYANPVL